MSLWQTWIDERLKHNNEKYILMVGDDITNNIWIPDTFIRQSISTQTHKINHLDHLARIYENGTVVTSIR